MRHEVSEEAREERLQQYLDRFSAVLGDKRRRASFATYALGLLSPLERKSMEPMAACACPDPEAVDAVHQRLQGFITDGNWSDEEVRLCATRYALEAIQQREPFHALIVDDTGFLKQGKHSVGVQRQYTGSAGKVTNCQIGVSLSLATADLQLPVDFDLYLPRSWSEDAKRRAEAGIPEHVQFQTKPEIALAQLQRLVSNNLPRAPVLADTGYGDSSAFRQGVRDLGLDYGVAVSSNVKAWLVNRRERRRGEALSVQALSRSIPQSSFRRLCWREGTRHRLSARFAFRRVVPFHDDGTDPSTRERVWLVIEWEDGEAHPNKFYFVTLARSATHKRLVRLIKRRWRTERLYEDLKGELGLDHFEGRRYRGWYHHVSLVMVCSAFVLAEHARAFPPSA